ncbi:glycosyltransferase family 2 protein [Roseomonas sp. HJA6]|uniref:Glycosyltransferase family 2 protein n=1 Tax=Roseomonas alba TaxID=2846776 RepID=A0ABS7A5E1_9PROT|nr:glycosyltransferase family A protein [Neoroseomonas alba]MBW6397526.1 glycosyltransferase family 2 protein [Neoroseomonas alba]
MSHRISVVVPTYNRAGLIRDTLETILGQTRPPDEVIVVDDGSTDGTAALLAGLDPRLQVIGIANSGDLAARNHGLRTATGDLVAFCDSDDLWRPGFLAAMEALWRAAPGMHAAFANFVLVRDGAWEERDKFADAPPGYWDGLRSVGPGFGIVETSLVDRLIDFQPLFPSCSVFDRAWFLGLGGWDTSVGRTVGTDFATALLIAEHPPIGIVQAPLVGIRKHGGNYSGNTRKMNLGDAAILEMMLDRRPSLARFEPRIRASIKQRRVAALDAAFADRDFRAVADIAALLPAGALDGRRRIKRLVANLPPPAGKALAALLLRFGSARAKP